MATTTAEQRREHARREFDAYLAVCPSRQVFDLVAEKWAGLLINALAGGPRRHGQLRNQVASISQKMLTQTLRELERAGLVARTVIAQVPVRVDYELTPLGHSLVPVLQALKLWSESHIDEILESREAYDQRASDASA